jgi:hypothetical protein
VGVAVSVGIAVGVTVGGMLVEVDAASMVDVLSSTTLDASPPQPLNSSNPLRKNRSTDFFIVFPSHPSAQFFP